MAALAKDVNEFAALRDAIAAEMPLPAGQPQDNVTQTTPTTPTTHRKPPNLAPAVPCGRLAP